MSAPRWKAVLAGALALLVWTTRWHFPEASAAPILDPSFMQALGYALVHRLQFGVDVLYTYGPLGWFNSKPHQPELDWIACFGWELALKLVLAVFFAAAALRLRSRASILAFALVLAVPDMGFDAYFFLAILAVSAGLIAREQRTPIVAVALAVLVLIGFVKFTYTLVVLVAVACIALFAARRSWKHGAAVLVVFALLTTGVWWAIGQSPANLPVWFAKTFDVARGFSIAQSIAPAPGLLAAGLGVSALGFVAATCCVRAAEDKSRARVLAIAWCAAWFMAFKAGFTRAAGNEITFFGFAAAAPFLLLEPRSGSPRVRRTFVAARASACVAALIGFCAAHGEHGTSPLEIVRAFGRDLARNVRTVSALGDHERALAAERVELARKYDLPHTRALVGDATVDVFGSQQAFVFLNSLHWHPRLVFQAFTALSDALQRDNARFMEGRDAPRFVLFEPDPIDGRLVGMEDARTLQVLLRDYAAVLRERGMLLLERRPDAPRPDDRSMIIQRDMLRGETLDLSAFDGRVLLLQLDTHLDFLGRARALALGAPVLEIELETDDGIRRTDRVVPGMMAGAALVRPWLQSGDDWVRFVTGAPVHALARVRFLDPSGLWHAPFVVRVWRADGLAPVIDPQRADALRWSMFSTPPTRVEGPREPELTTLRGFRDAQVVRAPSTLGWSLAPGTWRASGQFGYVPDAWRLGRTDGVIVRVERRRAGEAPLVVLERSLDPSQRILDGTMQDFDVDVRVEAGDEIALTTDPGPAGDAERDWVFWTSVSFQRRP